MEESQPSVAIVIPVFNRLDLTIQCLNSLCDILYSNFQIIVVDDGSTDGTGGYLAEHHPKAIVVKGDGDQWYSGGMNLGISKAFEIRCDYVLFLNNDNIVDPDFLNHLVETAQMTSDTIVCSLVYYVDSPKEIRFCGGKIDYLTGLSIPYHFKQVERNIGQGTIYRTDYAGGMGVLLDCAYLRDIGLLDYKHFPMCGDHEFWLRATRKKCYKMVVNPKAVVYGSAGQGGIRKKSTIRQLGKSLVDTRSCSNPKYVVRNYYRYFPKYLLPYYIFVNYFVWVFGGLTLIMRSYLKNLFLR